MVVVKAGLSLQGELYGALFLSSRLTQPSPATYPRKGRLLSPSMRTFRLSSPKKGSDLEIAGALTTRWLANAVHAKKTSPAAEVVSLSRC